MSSSPEANKQDFILEGKEAIIARHANKPEKGTVTAISEITMDNLKIPDADVNLILTVLKNEFPEMKSLPLTPEGLKNAIRLGDKLYTALPKPCVVVGLDSGKDRAQLTRAIVLARIAQSELKEEPKNRERNRIDTLTTDAKELTNFLADADASTWEPYAKMMKDAGISESEAITHWLKDLNEDPSRVAKDVHPERAAEKYKQLLEKIRQTVTSKDVPVIMVGFGHAGTLSQVKYDKENRPIRVDEVPEFCEMFVFNEQNELVKNEKL